ncbi:MAG: universal stress protein [Candidatus Rariloculaceae bacterium]
MNDKKILVVVDPRSDDQPAVERAAWLAQELSADLELFICDYDPDIDAGRVATIWIDEPARDHLLSILRNKLESLAAPIRERGLEVSVDVAWDHPLDAGILRKIFRAEPWLVVKDTHHHSVLKRTILSNTDWELIRRCPAPLLLVKPTPMADPFKVLAAVDPSHSHDKPADLDHKILELATTLVEEARGELHVLHSYFVPIELNVPDPEKIGAVIEDVEREHREDLDSFLENYPIEKDHCPLVRGPAHEKLPEFAAKQSIGIVVMGAVSRRGLDKVFIGSTAERILDHLSCDVLVVKRGTVAEPD